MVELSYGCGLVAGLNLSKIEWTEVEHKKEENAVYYVYEGTYMKKPIIRRVMRIRLKNGSLSPNEKETFHFDGGFWKSRTQLAAYIIDIKKEIKESNKKPVYK